ncbi:urease accessory protein UreE [Nitratireductor sp. ZSWI3]|uniref:urease accessory protein UreE n=1 Tax=Nitratireductor sp. ZSWI3 TaxID=2966359 RepID=UPI00215016ED|nr:urease accessory protein UreE [Nitratireductor sp. ZSWI3]MCR4266523.1 urease accessory protein UreE [Nitratireductor sp. ZSWI3]
MIRATSHAHAGALPGTPFDSVTLAHDERHLRRKLLTLAGGDEVLVDFPAAVALADGDALVLEDGRLVEIRAAHEPLYTVTGRNRLHLARLCWHLGNRHLPAEIREDTILIGRDHVIRDMLAGLGATVREVTAPFSPERGAYHGHGHGHDHGHHHHHEHG